MSRSGIRIDSRVGQVDLEQEAKNCEFGELIKFTTREKMTMIAWIYVDAWEDVYSRMYKHWFCTLRSVGPLDDASGG